MEVIPGLSGRPKHFCFASHTKLLKGKSDPFFRPIFRNSMSVQEVSHLKLKLLIILRFPSKAKDCAPLIKMAKLVEQHSFLRTVGLGPEAKTASQMDEGNRSTRIMQTLWDFGHVLRSSLLRSVWLRQQNDKPPVLLHESFHPNIECGALCP